WCSASADGTLAACRRIEAGCWCSKTDRAGAPVYLHRLNSEARRRAGPARAEAARAGPDLLHRVYSALLGGLQLSKAHREALLQRGLPDAEVARRGYRTLPVQGRARLANELGERDAFGDALLAVPGFIVKQGQNGQPYVTLAGAAGLLVPI